MVGRDLEVACGTCPQPPHCLAILRRCKATQSLGYVTTNERIEWLQAKLAGTDHYSIVRPRYEAELKGLLDGKKA
jgi:hypothetical protein